MFKQQVIVIVAAISPTLVKKNRLAFALLDLPLLLLSLASLFTRLLALLDELDDDDDDAVALSGVTRWLSTL